MKTLSTLLASVALTLVAAGDAGAGPVSSRSDCEPASLFCVTAVEVGEAPMDVVIGDFNADGLKDLAVSTGDLAGIVSILMRRSEGSFQPRVRIEIEVASFLAVGDFNGDVVDDLAIVKSHGQEAFLAVVFGSEEGPRVPPVRSSGAPVPNGGLVAADFDGDGLEDLALATGGDVKILASLGDGGFASVGSVTVDNRAEHVATADFNGDGAADLAIVGTNSLVAWVALGLGDGTFREPVAFPGVTRPGFVAAGDLDADGFQDLVVINFSGGDISVLPGLGDGTFGPVRRFGPEEGVEAVTVGDFNGDGFEDLAAISPSGAAVFLLLNDGGGSFETRLRVAVGNFPRRAARGDLNLDGRQDLAVANQGSGDVSLLLSCSTKPRFPCRLPPPGSRRR